VKPSHHFKPTINNKTMIIAIAIWVKKDLLFKNLKKLIFFLFLDDTNVV
jgi:hypothetical protein